MAKIITHPGSAHLDDFLSTCLVMYKARNIEEVLRREPTDEEILDKDIWKLDVGDRLDPDIKCYDHHQEDMKDSTLSLLLKEWNLWEKAIKIHDWLPVVVTMDASGPSEVIEQLSISYSVLGKLDSFVERALLTLFERKSSIKKGKGIFSLLRFIGREFFRLIEEYDEVFNLVEKNIEYKEVKGVPIITCLHGVEPSSTLFQILREKKREMWPDDKGGIIIYPNNRPIGTIAMRRLSNDRRVDFTRIGKYENVNFAHVQGFFISLEPMSDYELERYIEGAIKGK